MDGDDPLDDALAPPAVTTPEPAPDQGSEAPDQREDQHEDPPPVTGDATVDEATAEVAATSGEALESRLAAYERAHRTLQDRLADVEG